MNPNAQDMKYTQVVDEKTGEIKFVPENPPGNSQGNGDGKADKKQEREQREKEKSEKISGKLPQDIKDPEAQTFITNLKNSHVLVSPNIVSEYDDQIKYYHEEQNIRFDFAPNGKLNDVLNSLEANNKKLRYNKRLQTGKLDGRRLTSYKTSDRLFKKKSIKHKDYQFNIMIDLSGSMFGEKLIVAMNTAAKTTKALEEVGFKVAIWGVNLGVQLVKPYSEKFDDEKFKSLIKMQVCSVAMGEEGYEEYIADIEGNKERGYVPDPADYGEKQLCGGTMEAVAYAEALKYSQAHSTDKTKHVAIVLSDGAPGGSLYETPLMIEGNVTMVDHHKYTSNRVDDLYKWWERHPEITGYGIGINSVCGQVPSNQTLDEVEKLPEVVSDLVQRIIF